MSPFATPSLKLLRRLTVLLLALVVLAPSVGLGRILYSCGMTGRVSAGGCCCHRAHVSAQQAERAATTRTPPQAERPDCCQVQKASHALAPAALLAADAPVLPAGLLALLPAVEVAERTSERVSWLARAIRGPPDRRVFAANCTLLI